MIPIKLMSRWFMAILLVSVTLFSCKREPANTIVEDDEYEVIHTNMQYYDFNKVENLSTFFDSIRREHPIPMWIEEDEEIIEKDVLRCIKRIEVYRQGTEKYYPDSLVRRCIDFFFFFCAIIDNHGLGVDMTYAEWFLMLAAYYSPDVTCLVNMQSPNHQAGILNFGSTYNFNPWWCYIFFKRNQGFEVRRIGGDETNIDKLFQIVDDENRLYYLCSNNGTIYEFLQILFWVKDDNDVLMVAESDSLPVENWDNFEECYYNPEQRAWYCCNKDKRTGKMIPISSKPALVLKLDGENSRFIKGE